MDLLEWQTGGFFKSDRSVDILEWQTGGSFRIS